jgi:hypothetical protein
MVKCKINNCTKNASWALKFSDPIFCKEHGISKNDENIRYDDVYMIHSGKWIFIRYNPDSYKNYKGIHCNPDKNIRLLTLKNEIEKHIKRINNDENKDIIEIYNLFFDEFKQ